MKVGITGGSSGIGRELIFLLESRGYGVTKFGRNEIEKWEIGRRIPKSDVDILFHLAHDRKLSLTQNREAIELLTRSFSRRIVYISSTSAHPNSLSTYGKSKYLAEQIINKSGGVSLVSGLIYGNEAMSESSIMTKISRMTKRFPILPVPFAEKSHLYFSEVHSLAEALLHVAESNAYGSYRAFSSSHLSLRDLIVLIGKNNNRMPRTMSVPDIGLTRVLRTVANYVEVPGILDSLLSLVNEMPADYVKELKTIQGLDFPVYS